MMFRIQYPFCDAEPGVRSVDICKLPNEASFKIIYLWGISNVKLNLYFSFNDSSFYIPGL